jgi:stage II sporulation protein AA (anti-sigma F factor antagonist)
LELLADDTDGIRILRVRGRVDSATAQALGDSLVGSLTPPGARLIADMSGVDYLSSAGLRVLLLAMQQAQKANGRFVLHGLNSRVAEVFEISGFNSILTVCASRDDALALMAA